MATRPTSSRAPALIAWLVGALLLVVVALLGFEGWLLWTGEQPITWYARCAVSAYPWTSVAAALATVYALGLLSGHFIWDANVRKQARRNP